ncbi:hypothetical protein KDAU_69010 [Dictyobacter aurantiacus]|uniref:Uncharacterized protein n=1 Tax=Dictyobacter aurantiacus TaxID=1936993 RepID=A0A401ZRZ2_9CHLR|nr:hypothetical protein KDAU_69010 [Dictyobacter aurantiacus]
MGQFHEWSRLRENCLSLNLSQCNGNLRTVALWDGFYAVPAPNSRAARTSDALPVVRSPLGS